MARRNASRRAEPAPPPADTATLADPSPALWSEWLDSQRDLFGAGLDQLALTQQSMLESWLAAFDEMAKAWQAPLEGGLRLAWGSVDREGRPFATSWTFAPTDAFRLATPLMQAWWGPWAPFFERGGEQLG